jgi:restriction system protein
VVNLRQLERERKLQYQRNREAEAARKTDVIERAVLLLETVLVRLLNHPAAPIDFKSLYQPKPYPIFDKQGLDDIEPEPQKEAFMRGPPQWLERAVPMFRKNYESAVAASQEKYDLAYAQWKARDEMRSQKLADLQQKNRESCERVDEDNATALKRVQDLEAGCASKAPIAIGTYFQLIFDADRPLAGELVKSRVAYVVESRQLVVELECPTTEIVPPEAAFHYKKTGDEVSVVKRSLASSKEIYTGLICQLALRGLFNAFHGDGLNAIDTIALSCFVSTTDPATGQAIRPCLLTVVTSKDEFAGLNLRKIDPVACIKGLRAQVSRSAHELIPVKPVVEFDMVDPRFVEKGDVLRKLDQRSNLADLTPNEFETLMTNLFEKMGLETRLTRPSRDGGVDCVAYDMRPVIGGKVIIQAKRYRRTVGVSAVRDLFGTLHNEGAAKGILVATSGYGKSAYEFASNKPIELIPGSQLLYLLKEYTGVDAKIEFPDDWVDPSLEDTD